MDARTLFNERVPEIFDTSPEKTRELKELDAVFLFKVSGEAGGTWTADLRSDPPSVQEGEGRAPDCTVELSDDHLQTMLREPYTAAELFFEGKVLVMGDPMLATRLLQVFTL